MKILIGRSYNFTIKVLEENSFLPKNLSTLTGAVLEILNKDTVTDSIPVIRINTLGTGSDTIEVVDATNGKITVHVSSASTSNLVESLGGKEDGYYNKSTYKGTMILSFSNDSDINVFIEDIKAVK